VANTDTSEIVIGVVLVLVLAGVAYYLLQRTQPRWSIPAARQPEIARGRQSEIQRDFSRVFSMTSAQGRGHDQALDGAERLRPHRSHAARRRRVAAG
jgi:hypothetical protein